jgi:hypothetical protein
MKPIKHLNKRCPILPGSIPACPFDAPVRGRERPGPPGTLIVRTERRSWLVLALTGLGAIFVRYLRIVHDHARKLRLWGLIILMGLLLTVSVIALSGCHMPSAQKGGHASTFLSRPGQTNRASLMQSDNPKEPAHQSVQSEQIVEYVLPAGTAIQVAGGRASDGSDAKLSNQRLDSSDPPGNQCGVAILHKAMPVRVVAKDRSETSIGGAQKDTLRDWAGKAANLQPVMWAGIGMMTIVAGALVYFGWWTKAAVAVAVGLGMVVLAETLPDHGTLVLFGGLGVFTLAALLILYAYYKGQLDKNHPADPVHIR